MTQTNLLNDYHDDQSMVTTKATNLSNNYHDDHSMVTTKRHLAILLDIVLKNIIKINCRSVNSFDLSHSFSISARHNVVNE